MPSGSKFDPSMSNITWKLRRATGDERTLEEWGISGAIAKFVNQGLDTVDLSFGRADLLSSLPFDPDEELVISRVNQGPDSYAYQSNGDTNGVFYAIGTNFGRESWTNPHTSGRIVVTARNLANGSVEMAVDRAASNLLNSSSPSDNWFSFDLGAGRSLQLTQYSYRARNDSADLPTGWDLQGSNDGSAWTAIETRTGLSFTASSWQTFTLATQSDPYRYFRLARHGADADGANYFGLGELELYGDLDREDIVTTFFRGRITGENRGAFGSTEGLTLTLSGPWWHLQKLIYQQTIQVVNNGTSNPTPANAAGLQLSDFALVSKPSSDIIVSTDQEGSKVDRKAMITDALNYAIGKGAPIAIGTIDGGIEMPKDNLQDATCAEVIQKSLRWTPDQTTWWDYSVDPPALQVRSRDNRTLLELDIADGDIAQVVINPRRDLIITGVTLNYLRRHQRTNFEFITLDKDEAGPSPAGIGALVATIELYGSYLVENTSDDGSHVVEDVIPQEAAPAGLALALYNAYKDLAYEGQLLVVADEVDDTNYMSRLLRVLNGNPAWAAASMDIQQVSLDLFFGRTELSVGPAKQLGPTDLVGLVRKGRTVAPSITSVLDRGGGTPNSPQFPPNSPDPRTQFGGTKVDVTLNFYYGQDIGFPNSWGPAGGDDVNVKDPSTGSVLENVTAATVLAATGHLYNSHGVLIGAKANYIARPNGNIPAFQHLNVNAPA